MSPALLHLLNIGTLATWLSLGGFISTALCVHVTRDIIATVIVAEETEIQMVPIDLGAPLDSNPSESPESADSLPDSESAVETLPAPPELAPLAPSEPLPEIPDLPAPTPEVVPSAPKETRSSSRPTPAPAERRASSGSTAGSRPASSKPAGRAGSGGGAVTGGQGTGMSASARLAAGRMPAPSYPSAARRAGQTGTVVVEFTIDTSGRVIAARAVKASPWPMLDAEAVRTVRRWKFPPGGVMTIQRPIVFQLR